MWHTLHLIKMTKGWNISDKLSMKASSLFGVDVMLHLANILAEFSSLGDLTFASHRRWSDYYYHSYVMVTSQLVREVGIWQSVCQKETRQTIIDHNDLTLVKEKENHKEKKKKNRRGAPPCETR